MTQVFQSTPFVRRETLQDQQALLSIIHFNPLPSWEGRRQILASPSAKVYFNPLPSWEGRHDQNQMHPWGYTHFNPLPSWEGRLIQVWKTEHKYYFNPLPSWEGRLHRSGKPIIASTFQSTPFVRRETAIIHKSRIIIYWLCTIYIQISYNYFIIKTY